MLKYVVEQQKGKAKTTVECDGVTYSSEYIEFWKTGDGRRETVALFSGGSFTSAVLQTEDAELEPGEEA